MHKVASTSNINGSEKHNGYNEEVYVHLVGSLPHIPHIYE